jgi:hypothetical protein
LTLKRATPAPVNGSDDNGLQGGAVHEGVGL